MGEQLEAMPEFIRRLKKADEEDRGMKLTPEEVKALAFYLTDLINEEGAL